MTVPAPDVDPSFDLYPSNREFPSVLVDGEYLTRLWLQGEFPAATVQTETDTQLGGQAWTIRVSGSLIGSTFTLTRWRLVLDTFAPSPRSNCRGKALLADHAMRYLLRGQRIANVAVVSQVTARSLVPVPDANTSLRHYAGTYEAAFSPVQ